MDKMLDCFGCVGNTIKVSAGHYLNLADPNPQCIEIQSIASALGKICRFGGHCPRFYSVAEHSVLATHVAIRDSVCNAACRAILMHDAVEAFIGDMVKPLKIMVPQFVEIEQRIESAIDTAFGLNFNEWRRTIKQYDRAMLKLEKTTMWPDDTEQWAGFSDVAMADTTLRFFNPDDATAMFLNLWNALNR